MKKKLSLVFLGFYIVLLGMKLKNMLGVRERTNWEKPTLDGIRTGLAARPVSATLRFTPKEGKLNG